MDDTAGHDDVARTKVGPVLIGQARQQLVPDLAIRLSRRLRLQGGGQGLNEVRSAHDADQLAVLDDGNALDAVLFQAAISASGVSSDADTT